MRRSFMAGPQRVCRLSTVVVHLICNQGVGGSNPSAGTNEIK